MTIRSKFKTLNPTLYEVPILVGVKKLSDPSSYMSPFGERNIHTLDTKETTCDWVMRRHLGHHLFSGVCTAVPPSMAVREIRYSIIDRSFFPAACPVKKLVNYE